MAQYFIPSGPMQTVAAFAAQATGTAIKTLLQIKPSATLGMRIVEWGISFDGNTANAPIKCELIETDVAATVTASVAADLIKFDEAALMGGDPTTNLIQVGTAATGYTATAEGTITAVRSFDLQYVAPTNQYVKQFPLGYRPFIQISKFARIRVTAANSVNVYCWCLVEI